MAVVSAHEVSISADPGPAHGKPGSVPEVRSREAPGVVKTMKTAGVADVTAEMAATEVTAAAMTTPAMTTTAAMPAAGECVRRERRAAERENCGQHKH
jgi:hypothetical protein